MGLLARMLDALARALYRAGDWCEARAEHLRPQDTSATLSYSAGFCGGWVGDSAVFSDTAPDFQLFDIEARKIRIAPKFANDFMADSSVNVLQYLQQHGAEGLPWVEEA